MNELLKDIPDKRVEKNTTSHKFKQDLINYLGEDFKEKNCLEIGTHKGYTARILSSFFKNVITCEVNQQLWDMAKKINHDKNNIDFLLKDVYNTVWDFKNIDVVFIDCDHHIDAVLMDIQNAINLTQVNQELIIIFDDYGLDNPWHGVKEAINKCIELEPRFKIKKFIGEIKGYEYKSDHYLKEREGVICSFKNTPLQKFYRIFDNELHTAHETAQLGFEIEEGLRIPDEYLNNQEFLIMRTCHGIGDWGIISAMPRLLKQKYPNCKVYVPSKKLLNKYFGISHENVNVVFKNNPYVDAFIDDNKGEVFHDHYRIFDKNNSDVPLLKQILEFWQFSDDEIKDIQPEIYWTHDEINLGNNIIEEHVGEREFGALLISDKFGTQFGKFHQESYDRDVKNFDKILKKNTLPYFYYSSCPLKETPFDYIEKALDLRHIDLRIQLYIKSKAKINISNQCGTSQIVVRYSDCIAIQRQFPMGSNIVEGESYL
jgi:hypothetical protein